MIIDKKLSILTYAGSEPLNLMAKDTAISSNPIKSNEWDKMIQAVDSIYATQAPDDTVPVFWTRRFSSVDQFGNISYQYAPHPQSTLKQLDSKASYYFILRDSSLTPLSIPSNGSLVLGYTDIDDLPYLFPAIEDIVLTKESFEYSFKPQIINLKPYQNYNYQWKVISSNWPVAVNALSGILKPASTTGTINSTIAFCPTTGECSDRILPYALPESCSLEQIKNPYVTLQLSMSAGNTTESLSDPFTITCNDCLPKARINISGIGPSVINEPLDDNSPNPSYSFNLTFNNLEIDKSYAYSLEILRADWPIVFVSPVSGLFQNKSINTPSINKKFYFCPTTGLCPPNGNSIPDYNIPNYPQFLTSEAEYNIYFRASLSGLSQDVCALTEVIYSDISRITYKKA
jgi:hypothetical protein